MKESLHTLSPNIERGTVELRSLSLRVQSNIEISIRSLDNEEVFLKNRCFFF